MQADISRDSFDRRLGFLRVIHQQGRPVLDAETNEQAAILLHYLQQLAADLLGPAAGPEHECGFVIDKPKSAKKGKSAPDGLTVSIGRLYVNGILCENHEMSELHMPEGVPDGTLLLFYLDVWEKFVSALADNEIADPALEGVTTTARSKVAWRIRHATGIPNNPDDLALKNFLDKRHPAARARLRVRPVAAADEQNDETESVGYTGENQLYRVELHDKHSIKWARDNASKIFPISLNDDTSGTLLDLGRDDRSSLANGGIVEYLHRTSDGHGSLHVISKISPADGSFELHPAVEHRHAGAYLRRWDHQPNNDHHTINLVENQWIELEHGLSILLVKDKDNVLRPGDYWLIPARSSTHAALWSKHDAQEGRKPDGVRHHYAPLAAVTIQQGGFGPVTPFTRKFKPLLVT